jgi:hypothetical protein
MKECIIRFERGPPPKKYTDYIQDNKTKSIHKVHFGDCNYQQYRTPLKFYAEKNNGTRKRMRNYFKRHSATPKRGDAIRLERRKSKVALSPSLLSDIYLW